MCVKLVIYSSHRWGWGGGIPSKGNSSNLMTWRQYCLDPQTRESVWNSGCSKLRDEHRSGGGGGETTSETMTNSCRKNFYSGNADSHRETCREGDLVSLCTFALSSQGSHYASYKKANCFAGFWRRANLTGSNLQSGVRQEERFLKTRYRKIVLLCAVANLRTFLSLTLSPPFCSSLQTEQGK